jgi:hypothetical protein
MAMSSLDPPTPGAPAAALPGPYRPTTGRRVFFAHLALTVVLVGIGYTLVRLLWYPEPYFDAMAPARELYVLVGVNLVLGPALTLVLFKPGKKGLRFDVVLIAVVQLGGLGYAAREMYVERPYFTVFAVDRFTVLGREDADLAQWVEARSRVGSKPFFGPLLAVAVRPKDRAGMERLIEETVLGGKPDIDRRPEFWDRYDAHVTEVAARAKPLQTLAAHGGDVAIRVATLPRKLGIAADRLGVIPLVTKNGYLSVVIDTETGAPLEAFAVDPWDTP